MSSFLSVLLPFQRFFIPALVVLLLWAIWQTVARRDMGVGLALYLALVLIADSYLITGIFIPGLAKGSIKFSEVCAVFLLMNHPDKTPARLVTSVVTVLFGLYFTLLLASVFQSNYMISGIAEFRRWMVPQVIAFVVARRGLGSPDAYRRFFLCMTGLFIIMATFIAWDLFFDRVFLKSVMLDHGIYWFSREKNRFGSFFLNPNYLGAFIVLVFPVAFVWATLERRHRVYAWLGLLVLVFSLVETQSRGALIAFGLGLLVLVVGPCGQVSRTRRIGFLAAFTLAFTLAMPGAYTRAFKRFENLNTETEEGRTRRTTWEYTVRIILANPLTGIGFGEQQFMEHMRDFGFEEEFSAKTLDAPHNSYLQVGVYAGLPALGSLLLGNAILLGYALKRALRGGSDAESAIVFGLAVGIIGFLACVFTDLQLFTPHTGATYWVFLALLLSIIKKPAEAPAVAAVPHTPPTAFLPMTAVRPRPARARA